MKSKPLLVVSILLNLALAAVVAVLVNRRPKDMAQPAALETNPVAKAVTALRQPKPAAAEAGSNAAPDKFDWRRVESADYKEYIKNLRAIGCPEETIRDIISADVKKLFEARRKQLAAGSTNKFEYWKPGNPLANLFNEEAMAQRKQLSDEKKALLKELLGVEVNDPGEAMAALNPMETLLDFLSPEKQNAIVELQQKYAGKMMKAAKEMQSNPKAMLALQRESDAELAQLLGPKDKEEFDVRLSQTAMMMRMRMTDFEPDEQEFRKMFAAQKKFDDEFGPYGNLGGTKEEQEKRSAAEKQLKEELKTTLGDERYRLYQYDQQFARSSLKTVAQQYNVPRDQAYKVFDIQETAQDAARNIRADQSLSAEQRQSALDAIRSETERAVNDTIGADAAKAYVEKGSWIKSLNRQPAQPANTRVAR